VCASPAAGAAAGVAHAGTASGRPAQFTAADGERNALTVDRTAGGDVRFTDAATPMLAGLWCVPIPLGQATCDPAGDPRDPDGGGVLVGLGDHDDRVPIRAVPRGGGTGGSPGRIRVTGGSGKDHLENTSAAFIRLEGGVGDDTLVAGKAAAGGARRLARRGREDVAHHVLRDELTRTATPRASASRSTELRTTVRPASSTTCRRPR